MGKLGLHIEAVVDLAASEEEICIRLEAAAKNGSCDLQAAKNVLLAVDRSFIDWAGARRDQHRIAIACGAEACQDRWLIGWDVNGDLRGNAESEYTRQQE